MVDRHNKQVEKILFKKSLCCYPPENEAAKEFITWLDQHSEYDLYDVSMRIDEVEREEDYYGNGGGYDRTMVIYQYVDETPEMYKQRISQEEDAALSEFREKITHDVYNLINVFNIYPNMYSQTITEHTKEIVDSILYVVKEKIHNKH